MRFSRKQILENHVLLEERNAVYRRHGYDSVKAARFVLACARPLSGRVLEIGTGKGRFLVELAKRVPRVVTVDPDAAEQRFARLTAAHAGLSQRIRFVVADGADLPFADASFDAVLSMNALHHIRDLNSVLDEILRVVKPDGKIVLADFDAHGFLIFDRIHRQERRIHVRTEYDFKHIVKLFDARNWSTLRCRGGCQEVLIASKKTKEKTPARKSRARPHSEKEKAAEGDGVSKGGSRRACITANGSGGGSQERPGKIRSRAVRARRRPAMMRR